MTVKRLITEKQRNILKDLKKHKGKSDNDLSDTDIKELVILLAKKAGIL